MGDVLARRALGKHHLAVFQTIAEPVEIIGGPVDMRDGYAEEVGALQQRFDHIRRKDWNI